MKFEIKTSVSDIESALVQAMAETVDELLKKAIPKVNNRIKTLLYDIWRITPTYGSLINGELNGLFGFQRNTAQNKVDAILAKASESIKVSYEGTQIYNRTFRSKVVAYIFKEDFRTLLQMSESVIEIEGEEDIILPWLNWLLIQGDKIIIDGWQFMPKKGVGRSKEGIMVKSGYFKVPSLHSGSIEENWLTRTIDGFSNTIQDEVIRIIDEELIKAI